MKESFDDCLEVFVEAFLKESLDKFLKKSLEAQLDFREILEGISEEYLGRISGATHEGISEPLIIWALL